MTSLFSKLIKILVLMALQIVLIVSLLFTTQSMLFAQEPLSIGIFPRRTATLSTQLFTPLKNHLAQQLGQPVKLITPPDFKTFWQDIQLNRYDIVHLNQYHLIKANTSYQAVAHNVEFNRPQISSAIYVRKDSGIESLADLKNKKVVLGGCNEAMIACLMPRYMFLQQGLLNSDYQVVNTNRPANGILAVFYRQADAAAAGCQVLDLPMVKKLIDTGQIKKIAQSEPVRHLPWAVKSLLSADLKEKIKNSLVSLSETEAGRLILKKARLSNIVDADNDSYQRSRQIIDYMAHNDQRIVYDTP